MSDPDVDAAELRRRARQHEMFGDDASLSQRTWEHGVAEGYRRAASLLESDDAWHDDDSEDQP